MHIKRLEIQGFKTFADRTVVELTSGITAVVGPNGSGKSNIADAITWVLGEQNVRNIRGTKSLDVIFAGSERRKPVGMAEVSLTLDNSCGTIPLSYNEITVTRRVFRSGESEYFINKTACRLKDIYELFLDTGMGREAYSMVSQGEIDAILSARPEDRRVLFEEAAGIKKYHYRRKEAVKKLDSTEANLRRVNDIVSELSGQIEPLAEQAEKAKRYDELVTRLREIETGLLINDLRRWSSELEKVRQAKVDGAAQIKEQDKRIADLEWEKEKLSAELAELDHKVEAARTKHQECTTAAQDVKNRLALAEQQQKSADETRHRLDSEIQQINSRVKDAQERLARLQTELEGATERETRLTQDVADRTKSLEESAAELESATRIAEDRKSAYLEMARDQAAKRAELESLRARTAELEVAAAKYAAEIETLEKSRTETAKKLEDSIKYADDLRLREKNRGDKLPPLRDARDNAQKQIAAVTERLTETNKATVGKSSRLSTLKEMAEAHEGFFEGVRAVMAAGKAGLLKDRYAVVADVISVPNGLEVAVEVALGASVQDIIADTVEDAKSAIRFLKENRTGRATFLPLDGVRPNPGDGIDLRGKGVQGIAIDLIDFDDKYYPAIEVLLGRVVVVDNIDNAVDYSRKASGWGRIVTLEGEIIVPSGAMSGGARHNKGPNLLGRKQEMDTLTSDLEKLDRTRISAEMEIDKARAMLVDATKKIEDMERESAGDLLSLVETERQVQFLNQEQKRVISQIEQVRSEEAEAKTALKQDADALAELEAGISAAGKENVDLDELVARAQSKLEELNKRRQQLSEDLMEMSVTLASVRERKSSFEQSIKQTQNSISDMNYELEKRIEEIRKQASVSAMGEHNHEALVTAIRDAESALVESKAELETLVGKRTHLAQSTSSVDVELKSLNHARAETAELVRDSDVKEARLDIQIAQTGQRLADEYEITVEEALAREESVEVARGTATEVGSLRREIKSMGHVNTGAIEEYDRVSERWEFLMTQKNDLDAAREKLLGAIKEIDSSTKDLFMTTFNAIGVHFEHMFRRLFGSGKAELVLTNPDNLLETGVEIIVQLPGKKNQNLVLLSGGERALTASALLFALLLARPSPFVMFDEVDAPLDDTNVDKFAAVLHEFSHNTQFIVVTHNRATMEASDTLYGVTMAEPGVSKLISVQLAEKEGDNAFGDVGVVAVS